MHFKSKQEAQDWAFAFVAQMDRPCVVMLDGNLGAGKTQMVRWFCEALGVREAASPTFAIHNEYPSQGGNIDHVDLYRVKSDADLEATGFWDLLKAENALIFVEWASRLPAEVWPTHWMQIQLQLEKPAGSEEVRILNLEIKKP